MTLTCASKSCRLVQSKPLPRQMRTQGEKGAVWDASHWEDQLKPSPGSVFTGLFLPPFLLENPGCTSASWDIYKRDEIFHQPFSLHHFFSYRSRMERSIGSWVMRALEELLPLWWAWYISPQTRWLSALTDHSPSDQIGTVFQRRISAMNFYWTMFQFIFWTVILLPTAFPTEETAVIVCKFLAVKHGCSACFLRINGTIVVVIFYWEFWLLFHKLYKSVT